LNTEFTLRNRAARRGATRR